MRIYWFQFCLFLARKIEILLFIPSIATMGRRCLTAAWPDQIENEMKIDFTLKRDNEMVKTTRKGQWNRTKNSKIIKFTEIDLNNLLVSIFLVSTLLVQVFGTAESSVCVCVNICFKIVYTKSFSWIIFGVRSFALCFESFCFVNLDHEIILPKIHSLGSLSQLE